MTKKPTKTNRRFLEDGTKVRVSKRSGAIIPMPEVAKQRRKPRSNLIGPKDTTANDALAVTFHGYDDISPLVYKFPTVNGGKPLLTLTRERLGLTKDD